MIRLLLIVLIVVLAGCKSGTSVIDPIVGQTKVEPPRTGSVSGQPAADPYYPNRSNAAWQPAAASQGVSGQAVSGGAAAAPGATAVPAATIAPGAANPPVRSGATQTPAFEANRSSTQIPSPAVGAGVSDRYPDISASAVRQDNGVRPVANLQPGSAIRAAATSSAVATAGSPAPSGVVSAAAATASNPLRPASSGAEGVIRVIEPRAGSAGSASGGVTPVVAEGSATGEPRTIDSQSSAGSKPLEGEPPSGSAPGAVRPAGQTEGAGQSIDIIDLPKTRSTVPGGTSQSLPDATKAPLAWLPTAHPTER
jgi:uncharacterized protein YceK